MDMSKCFDLFFGDQPSPISFFVVWFIDILIMIAFTILSATFIQHVLRDNIIKFKPMRYACLIVTIFYWLTAILVTAAFPFVNHSYYSSSIDIDNMLNTCNINIHAIANILRYLYASGVGFAYTATLYIYYVRLKICFARSVHHTNTCQTIASYTFVWYVTMCILYIIEQPTTIS